MVKYHGKISMSHHVCAYEKCILALVILLVNMWEHKSFFPTLGLIFCPSKLQIFLIKKLKIFLFWENAYSWLQGIIDKSAEVTQLQIDLIEAFKVQHPLPVEENSISINSRRDGSPMYNSAQPEVTEEQTVTIPGEEDLPARTPTPELLGNSSFFQ